MTYIPTEELLALLEKVIDLAIEQGEEDYYRNREGTFKEEAPQVRDSDPYKILVREISRPREKAP